jgi:hypothetical protein
VQVEFSFRFVNSKKPINTTVKIFYMFKENYIGSMVAKIMFRCNNILSGFLKENNIKYFVPKKSPDIYLNSNTIKICYIHDDEFYQYINGMINDIVLINGSFEETIQYHNELYKFYLLSDRCKILII